MVHVRLYALSAWLVCVISSMLAQPYDTEAGDLAAGMSRHQPPSDFPSGRTYTLTAHSCLCPVPPTSVNKQRHAQNVCRSQSILPFRVLHQAYLQV